MGQNGRRSAVVELLRETLLGGGRQAVVTVASSSMEPVLKQGDRITIEGTDPSRLRRGDIVVYESPLAGLVVHRLMWKVPPLGTPRVAFTKGDALLSLDRPFAIQEVLGRVIGLERGAGADRFHRSVIGWRGYVKWFAAAAAWGWRSVRVGTGRKALTRRGKR